MAPTVATTLKRDEANCLCAVVFTIELTCH